VHLDVFVISHREQFPLHYRQLIPFKVYPKGQSVQIPPGQLLVLFKQELSFS